MNKSSKIVSLVKHFQQKFGEENVLIADHWNDDLEAVELINKSQTQLAYISIYNSEEDSYYLSLEDPPKDNGFPYTPAGDFDKLNLQQLEEKVASHLQLKI